MSIVTCIILAPLLAAVALAFVPRSLRFGIRVIALSATLFDLVLATAMFFGFSSAPESGGLRYAQQIPWVESLGISYHVGVDGLNLGLLFMAAVVAFAATAVSWEIKEREKEFYILLLVMISGILGAFASFDLFFFFFFHELALIPTFLMIGIWGRGEKNYAAFKMTLYLTLGALLALAGLILLYIGAGAATFDLPRLTARLAQKPLSSQAQHLIFPLLLFGFGILVSLWPFHTWAPLGYASAPTGTAMLHAGVLKKFGLYGLIRVAMPLAPEAAQSWMHVIAFLCLGNILYCGLVAMRQRDLNFLIGNSSVAHMGFVFLGIASWNLLGVTGAVFVMVAHGFLAALTFGLSGRLYHQAKTLDLSAFSGLARQTPFFGVVMIMAMFAGCGLPGFANFVGEATVFFASWQAFPLVTILSLWGALVVGAVYMLRAIRQIFHGPIDPRAVAWADPEGAWRKFPFVLLLACLIWLGCFPGVLVNKIKVSAEQILGAEVPKAVQTAEVQPRRAVERIYHP